MQDIAFDLWNQSIPEPASGAGAVAPGGFATTPTDNAYRFAAAAPDTGSAGPVAALMSGNKWTSFDATAGKTIVTYSFADPAASVFNYRGTENYSSTLSAFSAADRALVRQVLDRIESVANVEFVEVRDDALQCGVVRYGYSQQLGAMNYAGFAYYPGSSAAGGDVWIDTAMAQPGWDFYRPNLLLHETLHALGLKHPFSGGAVLAADQDSIPNTVMSYSPVAGSSSGSLSSYPAEPMLFDIAALQYLYGATAASASDTTYDLSRPEYQTGFHTVWDAGGSDTFDASRITHAVTLDLRMGGRSDVGAVVAAQSVSRDGTAVNSSYTNTLTLAQAVVIERAVGTAFGDRFFGNASDNVLDGAGGLDTVVYSGSVSSYEVERAATGFAVRSQAPSAAKTDTLRNIERLEFLDGKLALDLDGNAGVAAKLLGAVFGADAVHNPRFVGIALSLLDGGMGAPTLAQLALDVRLGANAGAGAVADLLLANVGADGAQRAEWTVMLESGQASAAGLALQVADLPGNIERIGLVGLAEHGLAYAQ